MINFDTFILSRSFIKNVIIHIQVKIKKNYLKVQFPIRQTYALAFLHTGTLELRRDIHGEKTTVAHTV